MPAPKAKGNAPPADPRYQGISSQQYFKDHPESASASTEASTSAAAKRAAQAQSVTKHSDNPLQLILRNLKRIAYGTHEAVTANGLRKKQDFRRKVGAGKVVIGEPLKETFRHTAHAGADDAKVMMAP
ncbi:hypothetical protein CXG81DRAFT_17690 [Caulochytrium protostelioides]|uniref:CRIB domain-containing protein n=1 Tax=Caulochytrium protostelioides TaxID=1555241 RepID=A0A4P9XB82_9FUNG|nr:hypothetical protein CXG81DRAFT_17690 [Caulochytrium protostelioides]|eukprot:RKP02636.1 hypothetical protein CXG81DRAFT_17690 [Caulochytrium protostelioides]